MSDSQAIDCSAFEQLLNSTGGDMCFVSELIEDYRCNALEELARVRQCYAAGDTTGLQRAAHTLKSTSASFGADAFADLAQDLERMARLGALEGAGPKIEALAGRLPDVVAELQALARAG